MIVSIHQPAYLPWLGYLARIAASDVFVVLDTVQFEKNSFINRNRIKTPQGPLWLTVPVLSKGHLEQTLLETAIDWQRDWRHKHLKAIEQNYRKAACFSRRFEGLAGLYEARHVYLTELCHAQLDFWLDQFAIPTRVVRASQLPVEGHKSERILGICRHLGATHYLSGPLGRNYLDEAAFAEAGIHVRYHEYVHPTYPQLYGDFLPAMAAVDYWLNCADLSLFRSGV